MSICRLRSDRLFFNVSLPSLRKSRAKHCVLCSTMVARWMAEFHCNLPADHRPRPSIPTITLCPRSHIQSSPSGTHLMRVCRGYPTSQQSYSSVISSGNRISHRPKPFHRDHPASRQYLAFSDISHLLWREKSSVVSKKKRVRCDMA